MNTAVEISETDERPASLSAVTPRHYPPAGRRLERAAIPGGGRSEPTTLDQDMTRNDLVWTLQHLNFGVFLSKSSPLLKLIILSAAQGFCSMGSSD